MLATLKEVLAIAEKNGTAIGAINTPTLENVVTVIQNAEELGVLNRAIEEAESLYVLFNLQDALDLRGDDANRSAVWVTNECLKRLKALPSKPRVTLVFTQVDRYQTDDDFLHSFTPAELDLIGHDHPDVDWMMVSVLVPSDSEFG